MTTSHTGIIELALSELHTLSSYYERLSYACSELAQIDNTTSVRSWAASFCHQNKIQFQKHWLGLDLEDISDDSLVQTHSISEAAQNAKHAFKLIESTLELNLIPKQKLGSKLALSFNFFFLHARRLHKIINEQSELEIDLPRVCLMDTIYAEGDLPRYQISPGDIFDLGEDEDTPVRSIQSQREKKYDELIKKGHQLIAQKEYDLARESFMRALNFHESAQAYNLVGWSYSLEENYELAKKFCLKAIDTDPAYGAPYNDLGSYLLSEGEVNESLKWFELAKGSRNYQNREFPYINSGRAYIALRQYKKALKEFSMALTLAPFHDELHQTVTRLKETLNKSDLYVKLEAPEDAPLF